MVKFAPSEAQKGKSVMKMFVFEGSSEEIINMYRSLLEAEAGTVAAIKLPDEASSSAIASESSEEEIRYVSVAFARRVLTRRPLSGPVMAMLKTLYECHPEWVSWTALCDATGYSSAQFAGLKGAFGRRKSKTPGHDVQARFFEWRENKETGEWEYQVEDPWP